MPKSIAHGCGNMLLQHAKELLHHSHLVRVRASYPYPYPYPYP